LIEFLIILPVIIHFFTGAVLIATMKSRDISRTISLASAFLLLVSSLILFAVVWLSGIKVLYVGSWKAPFGISFIADIFSVSMLVMTAVMLILVTIYSFASIDSGREKYGFWVFLQFMIMGVCGSFLTGDIFNLFVWFEVMLMSSFVLIALGNEKFQLEGAVKYVTINVISSVLFLSAVGILYGLTGSLNMADLSGKIKLVENKYLINIAALFFLTSFGIKAAIFPLFFWLPASYPTPPIPVTSIFSALLTKVGVFALIRIFTIVFIHNVPFTHGILLALAGLTMVTGVLGAAAQFEFRRILAFHIVSQIGYLLLGLGLFTLNGLAATVFFFFHIMLAKTNLFFISGIVNRIYGSYDLNRLGGIYKNHPFISIMFMISAGSLAGIPPFPGFWAKLFVIKAAFESHYYFIGAVAILVSILTLYSMLKIWNEAFWKNIEHPDTKEEKLTNKFGWYVPVIIVSVLMILISVFPEHVYIISQKASEQILNSAVYIKNVIGK